MAIRHAHLHGRCETDPRDWALVQKVLADYVPPWVRRIVEHLWNSPDHQAPAKPLLRIICIKDPHRELIRLADRDLVRWRRGAICSLTPQHPAALAQLVAGRALDPALAQAG